MCGPTVESKCSCGLFYHILADEVSVSMYPKIAEGLVASVG